jgi:hypothetical protein
MKRFVILMSILTSGVALCSIVTTHDEGTMMLATWEFILSTGTGVMLICMKK